MGRKVQSLALPQGFWEGSGLQHSTMDRQGSRPWLFLFTQGVLFVVPSGRFSGCVWVSSFPLPSHHPLLFSLQQQQKKWNTGQRIEWCPMTSMHFLFPLRTLAYFFLPVRQSPCTSFPPLVLTIGNFARALRYERHCSTCFVLSCSQVRDSFLALCIFFFPCPYPFEVFKLLIFHCRCCLARKNWLYGSQPRGRN